MDGTPIRSSRSDRRVHEVQSMCPQSIVPRGLLVALGHQPVTRKDLNQVAKKSPVVRIIPLSMEVPPQQLRGPVAGLEKQADDPSCGTGRDDMTYGEAVVAYGTEASLETN